MLGGAELDQPKVDHPDDREAALSEYEAAVFPRSREIARLSAHNLKTFPGDGAPQSVAYLFARAFAAGAHTTRMVEPTVRRPSRSAWASAASRKGRVADTSRRIDPSRMRANRSEDR